MAQVIIVTWPESGVYMSMAFPSHYAEAAVAHFVPPMVSFICFKI